MILSRSVKFYIGFIVTAGSVVISISLRNSGIYADHTIVVAAAYFLALGAVAESLPVRIDKENLVSISSMVSIASILLFGVYTTVIIRFFGAILAVRKSQKRFDHLFNTPIYKTFFNGFSRGIIVYLAGLTYQNLSVAIPEAVLLDINVVGLLGLVIVYFAVDNILYSILFALLSKSTFLEEFIKRLWTITYLVLLSPVGGLLAALYKWQGIIPIILFWGPFLFARHAFEQAVQARQTFQETIAAFSLAVEAKDPYTNGHGHRVADTAFCIARKMQRPKASIDVLQSAAILHDIGKIGVSDSTLNKSATLSPSELVEMQRHAVIGAKILEQIKPLQHVTKIVRYHHVYYDGGGYPEVPEGDDVPIEVYILAVADAFDAMTTDRYYRKAMSEQEALQLLKEGAGTQFHPDVVDAFMVYWAEKATN